MRRWFLIVLIVAAVVTSLAFAAANARTVSLDLYLVVFELPLGVLVIGALFVGCLLGGLVLWAGVILPLRMRLAAAQRKLALAAATPEAKDRA